MSISQQKNFSLVELLVTISVLMILMSLISPTLNKMLRSAHEVTCSQGIRDLLVVTQVYADDEDGNFMDMRTRPNGNLGTSSSPYWAHGYWRNKLTSEYNLSRDQFYSPSNPKWNSDSFYHYGTNGSVMVMGRFYFGSASNKSAYHNALPASKRGTPSFANTVSDIPSQTVLWTDLNRKWQGYFVNPSDPERRHGSNHLYDNNLEWPSLSHNGNYDGSVTNRDALEIEHHMTVNGVQIYW